MSALRLSSSTLLRARTTAPFANQVRFYAAKKSEAFPDNKALLPDDASASPIDAATSESTPPTQLPPARSASGPLEAATISGAPLELQTRTVRIFQQTKPATQSSNWPGQSWTMDWDVMPKGGRWENPLMGWASSSDFMQGTAIKFKTKEDAIRFAEKQGYGYFVQEPKVREFRPKAYASLYTYSPGKLKKIHTK